MVVGTAAVIPSAILEGLMALMAREMDNRAEGRGRISPATSLTTLSSPLGLEATSSTGEEVEGFLSMGRDLQWRKARVRAMVEGGRDTGLVRDYRGWSSWK